MRMGAASRGPVPDDAAHAVWSLRSSPTAATDGLRAPMEGTGASVVAPPRGPRASPPVRRRAPLRDPRPSPAGRVPSPTAGRGRVRSPPTARRLRDRPGRTGSPSHWSLGRAWTARCCWGKRGIAAARSARDAPRGHDPQHLERGHDAVARHGVLEDDHVARLLAAEVRPRQLHAFEDVLVADGGAHDLPAGRLDGPLQPTVGQDRYDQAAGERLARRRSRARMPRTSSPSTIRPGRSTAMSRSASPSRANPTSAPRSDRVHQRRRVRRPGATLMFLPSGSMWIASTAPRSRPGSARRAPRPTRWPRRARCGGPRHGWPRRGPTGAAVSVDRVAASIWRPSANCRPRRVHPRAR